MVESSKQTAPAPMPQLTTGPAAPPSPAGPPGPPAGLADPTRSTIAAETARHYGNMRFTMFTVFTTIAGALLVFPFTAGGSAFLTLSLFNRELVGYAGLATSVLFALSEYRMSRLVMFYQDKAIEAAALAEPGFHWIWKWVIMVVMLCPPIIAGVFWGMYLCGHVTLPRVPGA